MGQLIAMPKTAWDNRALSVREVQVCNGIALGQTSKTIAAQLGLSHETVKAMVCNVFRKTGMSTRLELIAFLFSHPDFLGPNPDGDMLDSDSLRRAGCVYSDTLSEMPL